VDNILSLLQEFISKVKMEEEELTEEQKEEIKKLVIARLQQIPDNLRLCIG